MTLTLNHKDIKYIIVEVRRDQERPPNLVLHLGDRDSLTSETMLISRCPQNNREL